jgi:hypothetical protein
MKNANDITENSQKMKNFLPVTMFIVFTFLFEAFGLHKATNLVISVFISLMIFGVASAMLKEKFGNHPELKILQRKVGLLSTVYILIFAVAFLHWYQILHINIRWILFFVVMLIYFIILFKAVSQMHTLQIELSKGKK